MRLTIIATDIKQQIEKFKDERIGGRRRDFVETVQIEGQAKDGDVMDTTA